MDYFINDAKIRLSIVREELKSPDLPEIQRDILEQRELDLVNLLNIYEEIKINLHNNNLENSLTFVK